MRILNILFGALILAALAWTGWWYAVATGQEAALERWFAKRQSAGWQAEYAEIRLTGFPFRLERDITGIRLADPEAGWAWSAPWLEIVSGPVNPTRFDVAWPASQVFAVPGERAEIESREMSALLHLNPEAALTLRQASVDVAALAVRADAGWTARAGVLGAEVTAAPGDARYALRLGAETVTLPEPLIDRIDPLRIAGREVERLTVEGTARFDRPLDREVIEQGRLGLLAATIERAELDWGEVRLTAEGRIEADAAGFAEGEIDVTARQWRELLAMARRSGAIGEELARALEAGLGLIAALGGDRDRLDATLRFEGGRVWLGPVAIGAAPRLAAPRS